MYEEAALRERVRAVSPDALASYLKVHGWEKVHGSLEEWADFEYKAKGEFQGAKVRAALNKGYADYEMQVVVVAKTVAAIEHRSYWDVLEDLRSGMCTLAKRSK